MDRKFYSIFKSFIKFSKGVILGIMVLSIVYGSLSRFIFSACAEVVVF